MSFIRIDPPTATDGVLITAAGAAVRLDSTVPGRRPVEPGRRRRHPQEHERQAGDQDTVTLHDPDDDGARGPDPIETLRRGGFRHHA